MKTRKDFIKDFDAAVSEIRDEHLSQPVVDKAADRVWQKISKEIVMQKSNDSIEIKVDRIRNCEDFQALMPLYFSKDLSDARTLLLEDHTRECLTCRKKMKELRFGNSSVSATATNSRKPFSKTIKWAIAATIFIVFALSALPFVLRYSPYGESVHAMVQAVDGPVYSFSNNRSRMISAGEKLTIGESIRTAKEADAIVRLRDGSLIEMNERSEFSVSENSQATTVNLGRGQLILQVAKQKSGRLYVATPDCLVEVKGTILSVNSGTKGSRISVIEGEVAVDHAGTTHQVKSGEQYSTNQSLEAVPIENEISWSRNADNYLNLLKELVSLKKDIAQLPTPVARHSTRLLDLVPSNTVLYAALPNLTTTLTQSHKIVEERITQNEILRQWWNEQKGQSNATELIAKLRAYGEYLGEEIVFNLKLGATASDKMNFLVLANLKNSGDFRLLLQSQLEKEPTAKIIDDPTTASGEASVYIWIKEDLFAASDSLQQLKQLDQVIKSSTNNFLSSSFYTSLSEVYKDGANLIVAADLEKIIASKKGSPTFGKMGLYNFKHFIMQQKEVEGKTQSRAVFSFKDQRTGIASWLASPGPMGALEFVSPEANIAGGFVVKNPESLVEELMDYLQESPSSLRQLSEFERQHEISISKDIAATLGGEVAFAVDGPILPTPSWKVVLEVYDQVRLQQALEKLVVEMSNWKLSQGQSGLKMESVDVNGRTFYVIKIEGFPVEIHYTFANGYMVATPSRALLERALLYRESGTSLLRSAKFTAGLPEDGNTNFSAVFYHNVTGLIGSMADLMGSSKNSEQGKALQALANSTVPTLVCAYASRDRIVIASNTEGGPFGLSPANLLGLPNSFGMQQILEKAIK